jgi:hypothetical protein
VKARAKFTTPFPFRRHAAPGYTGRQDHHLRIEVQVEHFGEVSRPSSSPVFSDLPEDQKRFIDALKPPWQIGMRVQK